MKFDTKKLKQDLDPWTVAINCGMEIKKTGKYDCIYCPIHEDELGKPDTHFGSCHLTKDGFYCWACKKGGNVITMAEKVLNRDMRGVLEFLADLTGDPEAYMIPSENELSDVERKKIQEIHIATEKEKLLGLDEGFAFKKYCRDNNVYTKKTLSSMNLYPVAMTQDIEEVEEYRLRGMIVVKDYEVGCYENDECTTWYICKKINYNMSEFRQQDAEGYEYMISEKRTEKLNQLNMQEDCLILITDATEYDSEVKKIKELKKQILKS